MEYLCLLHSMLNAEGKNTAREGEGLHDEAGEKEKNVKIDDQTVVKVKIASVNKGRGRPMYLCTECNQSFPSSLDLEAHQKIDHARKKGTPAEA